MGLRVKAVLSVLLFCLLAVSFVQVFRDAERRAANAFVTSTIAPSTTADQRVPVSPRYRLHGWFDGSQFDAALRPQSMLGNQSLTPCATHCGHAEFVGADQLGQCRCASTAAIQAATRLSEVQALSMFGSKAALMFSRLSLNSATLPDFAAVLHVATATDSAERQGLRGLVQSALVNTLAPVQFHIITTAAQKPLVEAWGATLPLDLPLRVVVFNESLVAGIIKLAGKTRATLKSPFNYARFFLPSLLPAGFTGRVIYLDDDVIVRDDLRALAHMQLQPGHAASFCKDGNWVVKKYLPHRSVYQEYINPTAPPIQELALDFNEPVFNAGVFVADMAQWGAQDISGKLVWWLTKNSESPLFSSGGSQPPMMLTFYRKYTAMDPLWHVWGFGSVWISKAYPRDFVATSAKLMHWTGALKPWASDAVAAWKSYFSRYSVTWDGVSP